MSTDYTPFEQLSSAEQLARAQGFRDGGPVDFEDVTKPRRLKRSIFTDEDFGRPSLQIDPRSTAQFAALLRDWAR